MHRGRGFRSDTSNVTRGAVAGSGPTRSATTVTVRTCAPRQRIHPYTSPLQQRPTLARLAAVGDESCSCSVGHVRAAIKSHQQQLATAATRRPPHGMMHRDRSSSSRQRERAPPAHRVIACLRPDTAPPQSWGLLHAQKKVKNKSTSGRQAGTMRIDGWGAGHPTIHPCMHACCIASGNKIRGTGLYERSSDGICSGLPCCCWLCRRCLVALTLRLACQCTSKGAVPVRGTDNHTKKAVLPYEHAMRARDLSGRVGGRSCASGPTVSELSFFPAVLAKPFGHSGAQLHFCGRHATSCQLLVSHASKRVGQPLLTALVVLKGQCAIATPVPLFDSLLGHVRLTGFHSRQELS